MGEMCIRDRASAFGMMNALGGGIVAQLLIVAAQQLACQIPQGLALESVHLSLIHI